MPDIFILFARYFWLVALIMCAFNVSAYRRRLQVYITQYPERERGYHQFLIGFVVINVLVWSIMGVGILIGGLPSVFAYFNPSAGSLYVLAWHGVVISLWIVGIGWIFFCGGAQFLVDHPGLLNVNFSNPRLVQLWFSACILGGVLGEIFMWTQGSAIPMP
jgi:hypothetical protein